MAKFYPLASSSKGNCTYIGTQQHGILIDVGIGPRVLKTAFSLGGFEPSAVRAVFVTHEHSDHVRGLCRFTEQYDVPVYGSRETLEELIRKDCVASHTKLYEINRHTVEVADMEVRAFTTSHDSVHSLGYRIRTPEDKAIGFCTDLGVVTPEVQEHLEGCSRVMLESNYDREMLRYGIYPPYLKRRIASDTGHLSNDACAAEAARLAKKGNVRFVLGHLSEENNRPELALQQTVATLEETGMHLGEDYTVWVAPKTSMGASCDV